MYNIRPRRSVEMGREEWVPSPCRSAGKRGVFIKFPSRAQPAWDARKWRAWSEDFWYIIRFSRFFLRYLPPYLHWDIWTRPSMVVNSGIPCSGTESFWGFSFPLALAVGGFCAGSARHNRNSAFRKAMLRICTIPVFPPLAGYWKFVALPGTVYYPDPGSRGAFLHRREPDLYPFPFREGGNL